MDKTERINGTGLERLRDKIDEIDQRLVDLLAARKEIVNRVVAEKKAANLPVYHPAREEDIISARRDQARQAGIDPDHIEELFRLIMRQSRLVQTGHMASLGLKPGEKILIVGGFGGMGGYFAKAFTDAGCTVRLMGRKQWPDVETLCEGVGLAIVSVPIESTLDTIYRLGPYLPENAVLADVTSIKQAPVAAMLKAHKGPVIGLHPLFGPTTSSLDKQIIVTTPGRDQKACQWVIDQFAAWGAVIVMSDPKEHDDIMGIVQALRHFATFAFGGFLMEKKVRLSRTLEFSSPIYRLELAMVGRLFAQSASLYAEIIFASEKRRNLIKDYIASIGKYIDMLDSDDKDGFMEEFTRTADWFGSFSEQAMRESSFLIDKLIERF
ncbi:MAG: bifunctional chorismate mutase/prephenate dehydrogenase [Deltaproteobacteria bacterium]|nr:bifunctional chorismate mutase/prephenate dehydrogenase [Deltaproteobacteria bacterium]